MPFPELRGNLSAIHFPAIAELKLDGEFNWLIKEKGDCYLINKRGKERRGFPALHGASAVLPDGKYICELYWREGKAGMLYEFLKHQDDDTLRFSVIDVVEIEGVDVTQKPYIDRLELLCETVKPNGPLGGYKTVNSPVEVEAFFQMIVAMGYEGIVVKDLNSPLIFGPCSWVKIKKKDESEFSIASIDPVKERIEVNVFTPSKTGHKTRQVGVKVCNKDKAGLKVGDMVRIEHQGILSEGGLRHPVYKGRG